MPPAPDAPFGRPVVVAPMAGGPTTVDLAVAAVEAGAVAFLAGGYQTAVGLRAQIDEIRNRTDGPFGVNIFVPGEPSMPDQIAAYVSGLAADAERLGAAVGDPAWDDDDWDAKAALLVDSAPPAVSFTFGVPPADLVTELHRSGTVVLVTVTTPAEAEAAARAGARWVVAQGSEAGAHRGSHTNSPQDDSDWTTLALTAEIRRTVPVSVVASGGITTRSTAAAAIAVGAAAVQSGTAFLLCPEAGTHPVHRAALTDPANTTTRITRAFSGRPARGIVNRFMEDHISAPAAYPEINNATRPLRSAAAASGEMSAMSLWAGQCFRAAEPRPAGEVVELLAAGAQTGRLAR